MSSTDYTTLNSKRSRVTAAAPAPGTSGFIALSAFALSVGFAAALIFGVVP